MFCFQSPIIWVTLPLTLLQLFHALFKCIDAPNGVQNTKHGLSRVKHNRMITCYIPDAVLQLMRIKIALAFLA